MVGRWDTLQRGLSHPSFHRAVKADIDLLRVVCTTREQALLSQGPSSGPPPPSRVHYRCATPLRSAHSFHYRPISIFFVFFFCLQMASIEVSLSTTPRRKKGGSISGGLTSPPGPHRNTRDHYKELDALRIALRDKENIIQT